METVGTYLIVDVELVRVIFSFSFVDYKFQQEKESTDLDFFKQPSTFPLPLKVSLQATDNEL